MTRPARQSAAPPTGAPAKRITLSHLARETSDRGLAILDRYDPELGARLTKMRVTRPDKPTVVVVGEAKRGKSSLINALINVPGLSPVDSRVATSTYIMFRRGPKPRSVRAAPAHRGRVRLATAGQPQSGGHSRRGRARRDPR